MSKVRNILIPLFSCALVWSIATEAAAQSYGRQSAKRGGQVSFEPTGSGVLYGALDPTVQRWYVPQELLVEYQWQQREYSNYGRHQYQRYVDTVRQGDHFYDFFGSYLSRGWLVYDWRNSAPGDEGSAIFKSDKFDGWFSSVTVSGDRKGDDAYAITVGSSIRTLLTPMTFSKPNFNGVQIDMVSDRYAAMILASRISDPLNQAFPQPRRVTNSTSLVGGRTEFQVTDLVTLGGTFVNARNSHTALDLFSGNFLAGNLTAGQSSAPVTAIAVILGDDSPEDLKGGAALFTHDIKITTRDFTTDTKEVWTLADVVRPGSEWPAVFGGFERGGFLAADGTERIILNYDFTDPGFQLPPSSSGNPLELTNIIDVEFDYVLANDYKIEMWSNRQTGVRVVPSPPITSSVLDVEQPALLLVRRAEDNVTNISNIERVSFNYGLPTGNTIAGLTIEATDLWGIDFYGEWDRNFRFFQYPNATLFNGSEPHEISNVEADARYFTAAKQTYPFFAYGEAYDIGEDYTTNALIVSGDGNTNYDQPTLRLYEFVDDNDDQDGNADWVRPGSGGVDRTVFPGWDDNNDTVSDFNQNDNGAVSNELPDYDEPFLRYNVERPELLFGIDLNNNGWIDRFEDDNFADYPYKADRAGYNVFTGVHATPEIRLMVGRTDEHMISDDRENRTTYGLFTLDKNYSGIGRVRVFDMLKRVSDNIPDVRRQSAPFRAAGVQPVVEDFLRAPDTWVNSSWVAVEYTAVPRVSVEGMLKYEFYSHTKDDPRDLSGRRMADTPKLFGLVNKVEYRMDLGSVTLRPRLKSEFFKEDSFIEDGDDREHWLGTATLLAQLPVLNRSALTAGVELAKFDDRVMDEDELEQNGEVGETGDERSVNVAFQVVNHSNYLGYQLTTHVGLRLARVSVEQIEEADPGVFEKVSKGRTETTSFITIYAGVR